MICKFCGNENPDELQYCSICGKELQNNLLRSLVGINPDGSLNTNSNFNSTLGGVPNKGFEDTGGGAASGPRRTMDSNAEVSGSSAGTIAATVIAVLTIVAVAAYFLIFSNNAPLAFLQQYIPFLNK